VWGERDSIIPADHGLAAHQAMPGSRLEIFAGAGHMPHDDDPQRFADVLTAFCESTEPARLSADHWGPLLDEGGKRR
jgi:pimeloyl-ACP methyl ester carboxylesterase